ncbi:NADH:flavorubredoxin reductase NorW (plasmid) [Enterobacteriaceae bacterium Kacie_13]|nr:NADH:flavorubredoxin reductase NorW [Enterobacteriaceae bacterium Kacie_13]
MNNGILIIGSGFAARQLVKNLRKQDADVRIVLIADDSCDEYNKPDLSHVISQNQQADALTRETSESFARQNNLELYSDTRITAIDIVGKTVSGRERSWQYDKLVLATGASAIVPPIPGSEHMMTLNSQREYRECENQLQQARHVLILGGGLIGCELAMDMSRAGKQVTVVDQSCCLLSSLMPAEVSSRLQYCLQQMSVELALNQKLTGLQRSREELVVTLNNGREITVNAVVSSVGLRPDTQLAMQAGLRVNRGIEVNDALQTSAPDVYALGDCAEIEGKVLPFLQPIQFSAMTLAKNLLGARHGLTLPAMLIKVKTPNMPLHLAGETQRKDLTWTITTQTQGMVAKGFDADEQLRAFVVSEDHMKQAFALLKSLNA